MPDRTKISKIKYKEVASLPGRAIIVMNAKGGVGKSTVTRGVAYAHSAMKRPFTLVDTDHGNPDLLKEHGIWSDETERFEARTGDVDVFYVGLKVEDDFGKLGDKIEKTPGTLVINTPAGSGNELLIYWGDVFDVAVASGHTVTILVPIDRGRDAVESLRDLVDVIVEQERPQCRLIVLKNLNFGMPADFEAFDAWAKDNKPDWMDVQVWPKLSKVVVDRLASERATLNGCDGLTMMQRTYLQRYQRSIVDLLVEIGVVDG